MENFSSVVSSELNNLLSELSQEELNRNSFFDQYLSDLKQLIDDINKYLPSYSKAYDDFYSCDVLLDEQSKGQTDNINSKHNQNLYFISNNSKLKVNTLRKEIDDYIIKTNNLFKSLKDQKLLIASTTNSPIYSNLIDRNSKIELYGTNKKEILASYNEIVDEKTTERNQINAKFIADNNKYMHTYNEASTNVISSMEANQRQISIKLNQIDIILNNLKTSFEKKCVEIEKQFNEEVRSANTQIINEKAAVKKKYEEDKQAAQELKSQADAKNISLRSQAMKEFAKEVSRLNDKLDMLKANQTMHIKENTNIFELNLFEIKARIRALNEEQILSPTSEFVYKLELRELNKLKKNENKSLKKKLKTINKSYTDKYNTIEKEKDLQESIKNDQVSKLSNISIIDENTYHNKLQILQKQYDYSISALERQLEFDVKKLRSRYDEEKLEVMKEYKIKQTNLFKQRQALVHQIDIINDEIEMANKLDEQVQINNKKQIENETSKINIDSLLEIEKNDMLTEYHLSRIEKLIDIEKSKYTHSESLHFAERDKKSDLLDVSSKEAADDLDHSRIIYGIDIEKVISREQYQREIEEIEFSEKTGTVKVEYTYAKFVNRKPLLMSIYNICTRLLQGTYQIIDSFTQRILATKYSPQSSNDEYYSNLAKTTITFTNNMLINIIKNAAYIVYKSINDQITLETGDKYSQLFEGVERDFKNEMNETNEREENIKQTIKNYNSAIRKFYSSITQLDSKIKGLTAKLIEQSAAKAFFNKELADLKSEKKRLLTLINKNQQQIDSFKMALTKIPKTIDTITATYEKKKAALTKRQQEESSILFNSLEAYQKFFSDFIELLNDSSESCAADSSNSRKYLNNILKVRKNMNQTTKDIKNYLELLNKLTISYSNKHEKLLMQNNISFNLQNRAITRRFNKKLASINSIMNEENERYSSKVRDNLNEKNGIIQKYDELINDINTKYEKDITQKNADIERLYKQFYTKTYAIKLSLINNISKTRKNSLSLEKENRTVNKALVNKYVSHKQQLISNNAKAITDYKESVNYIPTEFKVHVKELRLELEEMAKEYLDKERAFQFHFNKEIKEKNKEALKYSQEIHDKIIKLNQNLSKNRKALAHR